VIELPLQNQFTVVDWSAHIAKSASISAMRDPTLS
jgi:hypothetical protein